MSRAIQQLAPILRRSALAPSSGRRMMSSGTHTEEEVLAEVSKWRNITYVAYVACLAAGVYNFVGEEHHGHDDKPAYAYLRIRNKEFPWGPCGLFEQNCGSEASH